VCNVKDKLPSRFSVAQFLSQAMKNQRHKPSYRSYPLSFT
jgi:hypothetical protein